MASSPPDGTQWHVVFTRPKSKTKLDGFLTIKYLNGSVVRKIFLSDAASSKLADRLLRANEHVPVDGTLEIDSYEVSVVTLVDDDLSSIPRSLPARPSLAPPRPTDHRAAIGNPHFSLAPPRSTDRAPIGNLGTKWNGEASSIATQRSFSRSSSSLAPPRVDRAPIGIVGTEWNVLYTRNPTKKVKKTYEGVLRLVQKNREQQKVVLCDSVGKQIDEMFLGGGEEIRCGKTLHFDGGPVEVGDIKGDSPSLAEVVVVQDSPVNQKKLPRQHPKSSFQGTVTNRASPHDRVEPDIWEVIQDSGSGRIQAPSKACEKQEIQPKRRDSGQIINSLKRPVNSFSRESSSTANSCTREPVEREGTSMLSSTSRRRYEEEKSATLDCVDRIQKLNVGKACPESFDDDCIYIEYDVKQRKNRLGNNRPGSVINLDDQFDVVVEQYEVAAEKVESDASLHTRRGFTKCSEEVENILDDNRFRVRDFWDGYKLYCFGHYSHCDRSKEQFLTSKMGRVVCLLHNEMDVRWGSKFDETVRHLWAMMEEYVMVRSGKDCTNLRALMEEFEDVKKLSTSENGSLLIQLIKHVLMALHTQDDEHGTERLYKHSRNIQIQSTNVFDQFRSRLNQVDSNLGNLMKSSGKSLENSSGVLTDLDSRNLGLRNSRENGSVGNAAKFSVDRRNKPKEWCKSELPSFELGF